MAWTTAQDVIDAWIGDDAPDDLWKLQKWIDKAEREIRRRVPDLQARIDVEADLIPPVDDLLLDAIDVTVAMVTRVFRNPRGTRQKSVTTGPFSEQETFGGNNPGLLELTDEELSKLQGTAYSGAFTIDLIPSSSQYSPNFAQVYPWV